MSITRWHWTGAAAFWLFIAAMYSAQIWWVAQTPGERINIRAVLAWQTTYYLAWIPATVLVWRVTGGWLPASRRDWRRILLWHLPVFIAVLALVLIATTALALPLAPLPGGIMDLAWMQLRGRGHLTLLIYAAVAGAGMALAWHGRFREREAAAAALHAELASARLQALRSHLEPHFLFNSLNSIAALARVGDSRGVVRLTAGLGDILRHVLDAAGSSRLSDEFVVVERYLDIQRARFADRLDVALSLAPAAADARVPVLIVQPLVENALKHGLSTRVEGGRLVVRADTDGRLVRIDVEDDGAGLPNDWTLATSRGTGLRTLASRLTAEFGGAATLRVDNRDGGGVRARVTLPHTHS